MKRTTRNAVRTKQEIIAKAAPIFNVYGYAGSKMQLIVAATGFQKGGIYCHFDSKLDLAKAAFLYNCSLLEKAYLKKINPADSPRKQLLQFFENYRNFIARPTIKGGCPIMNTATEVDDTNKEFRLLAKSALKTLSLRIEAILQAGKESGDFRATIDPQKEVNFFFATLEGAIMIAKLHHQKRSFTDTFDRLLLYLEQNILV
ncbi:MAG: TetR/AcrR family transcriptional regulator [Saprospiraceae bacterium]